MEPAAASTGSHALYKGTWLGGRGRLKSSSPCTHQAGHLAWQVRERIKGVPFKIFPKILLRLVVPQAGAGVCLLVQSSLLLNLLSPCPSSL